jgi:hypothetical protein
MVFQSGRRISRKKTHLRKGGSVNKEIKIYFNLINRVNRSVLMKELYDGDLDNIDSYIEETNQILYLYDERGYFQQQQQLSKILNSIVSFKTEQLTNPYKDYNFLLTLTVSNDIIENQINLYWEELRAEYVVLNDNDDYFFDTKFETSLPTQSAGKMQEVGKMPELSKLAINVNFTDRMGNNTLTRKLSGEETQMLKEHVNDLANANTDDFSAISTIDLEQLKIGKHHFVITFTFTNPLPAEQVGLLVMKYIESGREYGLTLEDEIEYIFDSNFDAPVPQELEAYRPVSVPLSVSGSPPTLSSVPSSASSRKKYYGPFQCELNAKRNRCVQGTTHDGEHCRLNENNNCALAIGHQVVHRSKRSDTPSPKKVRSKRAVGESKPNRWIDHIRAYQATHPGMKWQTAMQESRPSYNKKQ